MSDDERSATIMDGVKADESLFVNVDHVIIALYKAGHRDFAESMERWKRAWRAE